MGVLWNALAQNGAIELARGSRDDIFLTVEHGGDAAFIVLTEDMQEELYEALGKVLGKQ